jgi:acetyl/propionyl-CoA carboxylase alpha subunit
MNFDVTVNGRPWRVALDPAGARGLVQVSVKGRHRAFDASWIDAETLLLIGADAPSFRVHEMGIRSADGGVLEIALGGKTFRLTVVAEGKPATGRRVEAASTAHEGRQTVVATMPGRIVRVLVSPGDRVSSGQAVVVVEAMKMENEMRSPKDGVVREIRAQEGAAIEAGAVLVIIE